MAIDESLLQQLRRLIGSSTVGSLDRAAASPALRDRSPVGSPLGRAPGRAGTCGAADPLAGIEILPEYEALEFALREPNIPVVILSGRAGTGKSTAVRWILSRLGGRAAVVAPTGLAALNAGGQTIHSLFRFPPKLLQDEDIKPPSSNRDVFAHLEYLVIDEISMVNANLMDAVGTFLDRHGPRRGSPFGGVKLLLVGDLLQLAPIVEAGDVRTYMERHYRSPFFFSAKCLESMPFVAIELERVLRQTERDFITLLNGIREGSGLSDAVERLNRLCVRGVPAANAIEIHLVPTRAQAESINRERLDALPGPDAIYTSRVEGKFKLEPSKLPAPADLRLRRGARVVFLKNDPQRRWINGTLGTVEVLKQASVVVKIPSLEHPVEVGQARWEQYEYRYTHQEARIDSAVTGAFEQIPLVPAWATTIHKAQGQSYEAVAVDLESGTFAAGQAYVALSRCRTVGGLRLTRPLRDVDVKLDPQALAFYRALRERSIRLPAQK
jgi:ATP-dependent DNA helicase PIF1